MSLVAAPPPVQKPARRHRTLWRDIVEVVLIAVALYVAISFALQTVRVDGFSMVNTLNDQDFLLASRLAYHLHDPQRGDIVVLKPPPQPTRDFIKRVIGLPGDTIEIDGSYPSPNGGPPAPAILVQPGGKGPWMRLVENYLPEAWVAQTNCCDPTGRATATPEKLRIPAGMYFVMGDNRNRSDDSRTIGLIPRQNILAQAWVRLFPFNHFGFLTPGPHLVRASTPPPASSSPAAVVEPPASGTARAGA